MLASILVEINQRLALLNSYRHNYFFLLFIGLNYNLYVKILHSILFSFDLKHILQYPT